MARRSGDGLPQLTAISEPMIQLEGLSKKIGRKSILSAVTLQVGNQVTGLLGPNGAGKSTLIKILLGLVHPSSGQGWVLGHDIRRQRLQIRQAVGFAPEDDCYIDGLTGVEMVQMSAQFFGIPGREALRRAHEVLDFCGIRQERHREISGYSTGMRQQIKFAAAIVHNPRYLILDEPTTGLDPEERERLLLRVRLLNRRFGIGVMLSTHILPDVQLICDDLIVLAEGRIQIHQPLASLQSVRRWKVLTLDSSSEQQAILGQQLSQHGLTCQPSADGGLEVCCETMEESAVARLVWECGRDTGVVIRHFAPTQESLETIFLKAIGAGPDAAA